MNKMKITVVGAGYVGLSLSSLLARHHNVVCVEKQQAKVDLLKQGISPIKDELIEKTLKEDISLTPTTQGTNHYLDSNYIILAVPTDYNEEKQYFNTSILDTVIDEILAVNPKAKIVIKSTIPIEYTERKIKETGGDIMFSPEFLREGQALYDNLYPSRIIVGCHDVEAGQTFAELLKGEALNEPEVIIMKPTEAETVKLFANTYLATRISFFNELDTFAETKGLDSANIIKGICYDPRIGDHYNNPSFGFGGYCLPKDTHQLKAEYEGINNAVIKNIPDANKERKSFIANQIKEKAKQISKDHIPTVGIYKLSMKTNSDNARASAILDVMDMVSNDCHVVVYDPVIKVENSVESLDELAKQSDLIVANRVDSDVLQIANLNHTQIYTRDIFSRD